MAHFSIDLVDQFSVVVDITNEKKQKRNGIVAIRAVAHKIARAVFHMLKNKRAFDIERAFS